MKKQQTDRKTYRQSNKDRQSNRQRDEQAESKKSC